MPIFGISIKQMGIAAKNSSLLRDFNVDALSIVQNSDKIITMYKPIGKKNAVEKQLFSFLKVTITDKTNNPKTILGIAIGRGITIASKVSNAKEILVLISFVM